MCVRGGRGGGGGRVRESLLRHTHTRTHTARARKHSTPPTPPPPTPRSNAEFLATIGERLPARLRDVHARIAKRIDAAAAAEGKK